ncbi:MAG: TolC family protein, partial [Opitutaceae bacterium]
LVKSGGRQVVPLPGILGEEGGRVRVEPAVAGASYRFHIVADFSRDSAAPERNADIGKRIPHRTISTSASHSPAGEPIFLQLGSFAPGRKHVAVFRFHPPGATVSRPIPGSQNSRTPPLPASGPSPRPAFNPPVFPTEFDTMESDPEILRERLRLAERQLELQRARFDSGLSTSRLLLEAQREVARLKAKLADDRVGFAKWDYELTRKQLEENSSRRSAGLLTDQEVLAAEAEFRIAEIRLHQEETRANSEPGANIAPSAPATSTRR